MTYETTQTDKSLWQRSRDFVAESLSDNETDFTVGPIGRALGLLATEREGEATFGWVNFDTTPYELRERSEDFIGTGQTIWAVVAGVYLALMGPGGMQELGETIMQRSRYAAQRLDALDGVRAPLLQAPFFKEFVVSFDAAGKSVARINHALAANGIMGGIELGNSFPELGNAALFCVTEIHDKAEKSMSKRELDEFDKRFLT